MTTPLKALIQERLRAKIVRQEVDGDDGDDVDDLLTMDSHHHRHHHREHHNHNHHHHQRDLELQSPSKLQQYRGVQGCATHSGNAQRTHQQQPRQQIQEDSANQYQLEDARSVGHRQKRHKGHHSHQQSQLQQQQPQHYSTNQKLLDYYTYEHQQKLDGYFRQDRRFGRGFHDDECYKALGYEQEEEEEESHRSPLASPWRSQSASNQFHEQDPEDEHEQDEEHQEQQEEEKDSKLVERPRYAPLPVSSQHQSHRSSSAELKHVRDRDSRVHPVELHGFRSTRLASPSAFVSNARELHQKTGQKQQQPLAHAAYDDSSDNTRERHVYPRGHFESQLYDDIHDSKQEEDPAESHHEVHHKRHHHHKLHHHHHEDHHSSSANFDPESLRRVQPRKRSFGTLDDAVDLSKPHERVMHRRQHEDTVAFKSDKTEEQEPALRYSHHSHSQQQQPRHHFNHDRFRSSAFYVDNLVTSPLAAASSLAPLVFAAATSPRLETKRAGSLGRQRHSQIDTGAVPSSSTSYTSSLGALPAPLDMAMIEASRRRDSPLDAMTQGGDNSNPHSSGTVINRRSSSTLLRRLDAMLSPGCHRAATAFVEKRRRRAANSTPRTMATQRWLQSMDPHFRERAAVDDASTTTMCQNDDLQYLQLQHQLRYQETPLALPPRFSTTARSASSCSNRSSSASSCASPV